MTLYEIDERLMSLIDPETGEILDSEAFDALSMERKEKIENVALWIKNEKAMSDALDAEIRKLQERKKVADNRVTRLKSYVAYATGGEKFATARVSVTFRNTTGTSIENEDAVREWAEKNNHLELLKYKPAEVSKTAVKDALNNGLVIPGCKLEQNTSVIIK